MTVPKVQAPASLLCYQMGASNAPEVSYKSLGSGREEEWEWTVVGASSTTGNSALPQFIIAFSTLQTDSTGRKWAPHRLNPCFEGCTKCARGMIAFQKDFQAGSSVMTAKLCEDIRGAGKFRLILSRIIIFHLIISHQVSSLTNFRLHYPLPPKFHCELNSMSMSSQNRSTSPVRTANTPTKASKLCCPATFQSRWC